MSVGAPSAKDALLWSGTRRFVSTTPLDMLGLNFEPMEAQAVVEPPDPTLPEVPPFAQSVAAALAKALVALRASGMVEVEDDNLPGLTNEVVEAVLESSSTKKIPLRITKTLIHSEYVEEVYGTDAEIAEALRPFLDEI